MSNLWRKCRCEIVSGRVKRIVTTFRLQKYPWLIRSFVRSGRRKNWMENRMRQIFHFIYTIQKKTVTLISWAHINLICDTQCDSLVIRRHGIKLVLHTHKHAIFLSLIETLYETLITENLYHRRFSKRCFSVTHSSQLRPKISVNSAESEKNRFSSL